MVDRPCGDHLDLFPPTKVNNMLRKYSIYNNDIVPFQININIHLLLQKQITLSSQSDPLEIYRLMSYFSFNFLLLSFKNKNNFNLY